MGAPVIFNGMCERAIKENVTGKSVILFTHLKYIDWDMIDMDLMKKAFEKNDFYNDDYEISKVDISELKKKRR